MYDRIFPLFRDAYFALGTADAAAARLGHILPELKNIQRDALSAK
jgi:L-ribulokinase